MSECRLYETGEIQSQARIRELEDAIKRAIKDLAWILEKDGGSYVPLNRLRAALHPQAYKVTDKQLLAPNHKEAVDTEIKRIDALLEATKVSA